MRKASLAKSPISLITASLASDEGLLNVLQIVDSFVTHPFDPTVEVSRESVAAFLAQLTPSLPSNLKAKIFRLVDLAIDLTAQRLVKVTALTPSSDDPHTLLVF